MQLSLDLGTRENRQISDASRKKESQELGVDKGTLKNPWVLHRHCGQLLDLV